VARKTLLATGIAKVLHHVQFKTAVQSNDSNPQTGKSSLKEYGIKVWCFKNSSNKINRKNYLYYYSSLYKGYRLYSSHTTHNLSAQGEVTCSASCLVCDPLNSESLKHICAAFKLPSQIPPLLFLVITPTSWGIEDDMYANRCLIYLALPYTLRKKCTKAVTGAVPFQKVHFCPFQVLICTF